MTQEHMCPRSLQAGLIKKGVPERHCSGGVSASTGVCVSNSETSGTYTIGLKK